MEYLYNPCGGRCSYAIGQPVIALEIRLTLSWVPRFSVHHHTHFCSVAWGKPHYVRGGDSDGDLCDLCTVGILL